MVGVLVSDLRVDWTLTVVVALNSVVVEDGVVDVDVDVEVCASCGAGASSGAVASVGASSASFVVVVVASCNGNVEPSAP